MAAVRRRLQSEPALPCIAVGVRYWQKSVQKSQPSTSTARTHQSAGRRGPLARAPLVARCRSDGGGILRLRLRNPPLGDEVARRRSAGAEADRGEGAPTPYPAGRSPDPPRETTR